MTHHDDAAFGQMGCKLTAATAITPPAGRVIVAITSFNGSNGLTTTSEDTGVWPSLSATNIPAGVTIYGRWTDADSTAGSHMVYFG